MGDGHGGVSSSVSSRRVRMAANARKVPKEEPVSNLEPQFVVGSSDDLEFLVEMLGRLRGKVSAGSKSKVTIRRNGYNAVEIEPIGEHTMVYEVAPRSVSRVSVDALALYVTLSNSDEKFAPFTYRFLYRRRQ